MFTAAASQTDRFRRGLSRCLWLHLNLRNNSVAHFLIDRQANTWRDLKCQAQCESNTARQLSGVSSKVHFAFDLLSIHVCERILSFRDFMLQSAALCGVIIDTVCSPHCQLGLRRS